MRPSLLGALLAVASSQCAPPTRQRAAASPRPSAPVLTSRALAPHRPPSHLALSSSVATAKVRISLRIQTSMIQTRCHPTRPVRGVSRPVRIDRVNSHPRPPRHRNSMKSRGRTSRRAAKARRHGLATALHVLVRKRSSSAGAASAYADATEFQRSLMILGPSRWGSPSPGSCRMSWATYRRLAGGTQQPCCQTNRC